jgi:hypothetical protein
LYEDETWCIAERTKCVTDIWEQAGEKNITLSTIDQHCALIITPLFDTQAATCFGIHEPSSGSFLRPYKLHEARNGYVVRHSQHMTNNVTISAFR